MLSMWRARWCEYYRAHKTQTRAQHSLLAARSTDRRKTMWSNGESFFFFFFFFDEWFFLLFLRSISYFVVFEFIVVVFIIIIVIISRRIDGISYDSHTGTNTRTYLYASFVSQHRSNCSNAKRIRIYHCTQCAASSDIPTCLFHFFLFRLRPEISLTRHSGGLLAEDTIKKTSWMDNIKLKMHTHDGIAHIFYLHITRYAQSAMHRSACSYTYFNQVCARPVHRCMLSNEKWSIRLTNMHSSLKSFLLIHLTCHRRTATFKYVYLFVVNICIASGMMGTHRTLFLEYHSQSIHPGTQHAWENYQLQRFIMYSEA